MNRHALEFELRRLRERYTTQPNGRIFAPMADCLRKLEHFDEAAEICRKGLEKHPDYPSGWVVLGKIQLDRGEEAEAAQSFARVLELDGQNLVALWRLARWAEMRGERDEALDLLSKIVALDPANADAADRIEALTEDSEEEVASSPPPVARPEPEERAEPTAFEPNVVEEPAREAERIAVPSMDADVMPGAEEDAAASREAPVDTGGDRDADRPDVPPAEIATITLAEIYYEQGFKVRALDVYRQVSQRNPAIPGVRARIAGLQRELGAATSAPTQGEGDAPEQETKGRASSGAHPSAPLRSPEAASLDEESERVRFDHFRSWLERIKVNDL